ncbi:MAG: 6-carboxytetrahydropterin synthase [Planctomycetota bacterium]
MLELRRTVRFCLSADPASLRRPRRNNHSAWPAPRGLDRYYELTVACRGTADPQTGYFMNIKRIDQAVRDHALPALQRRIADESAAASAPLGEVMRELHACLNPALDQSVASLCLALTPRIRLTLEAHDMSHALIRQQYEFSAAHRLHAADLSDDDNRAVFGKCNNPAGHGHNYRLEITARSPIDPNGRTLDIDALDAAVDDLAIEKLDHKHLNRDVPEFACLNPSVEHIAGVIWGWVDGRLPGGALLDQVEVWETGKTSCVYRGTAGFPAPAAPAPSA